MRADAASVGFRLRSARGHLDAVIRMADEDRYCIDLLHQISAVQGALDRVRQEMLETYLRGCLPQAALDGNTDEVVEELMAAVFGAAPAGREHTASLLSDRDTCGHRS